MACAWCSIPFRPDEPVLFLVLPFYAYLFGMLLLGIVIGGLATWMTPGALAAHARAGAAPRPSAGRPKPIGSRASARLRLLRADNWNWRAAKRVDAFGLAGRFAIR